MLCAVGLFSGLYHQQIKKNVLTSSEINDGFNSEDNASLKFSFWILVGSCFLPLINMLLTFLNSARAKSYFNKTTTIPTSNVDGMMLYWSLRTNNKTVWLKKTKLPNEHTSLEQKTKFIFSSSFVWDSAEMFFLKRIKRL